MILFHLALCRVYNIILYYYVTLFCQPFVPDSKCLFYVSGAPDTWGRSFYIVIVQGMNVMSTIHDICTGHE